MSGASQSDFAQFVADRLPAMHIAGLPGLMLHLAHPASGLRRLAEADPTFGTPYWAFVWAGGLALAHHLRAMPETVAGKHVLDLGTGSGLVAIVAAKAGARVVAADADPYARAIVPLNAVLNGAAIEVLPGDPLTDPPLAVDLVLAGDMFYADAVAARVTWYLDACRARGATVLVGDPGRAPLPRDRLTCAAEYRVEESGRPLRAGVYGWA